MTVGASKSNACFRGDVSTERLMRDCSSALPGRKIFPELLPRHQCSTLGGASTTDSTQFRMMSMITASIWVPRGAAANFPTRYDIDESELSRISKLAKLQLEDANEDLDNARDGGDNASSMDESEDDQIDTKLPKSQE